MRDFQTSTFVFEGMTFNIYELFIHNMNFTIDDLSTRIVIWIDLFSLIEYKDEFYR